MDSRPTSSAPRVLVVDDEEGLRLLVRVILEREGCSVTEARDGVDALARLRDDGPWDAVFCDIRMPRLDGMELLAQRPADAPPIVMMSAFGTQDTAIEALSRGAFAYVSKPFRADELRATLARILERRRLVDENRALRLKVRERAEPELFLGRSEAARAVMDLVERAAAYNSTVLITGESGTGKELLARALHARSPRARGPLVAVNCAAIPEALLESELFGHERGAFTGAVRAHAGFFEQAHGGTLLLDEVGDMPLVLQTRLLRVLEDSRVRRVGGSRDIEVDTRVVGATARDLEAAVAAGRFREDLYYRLNVVRVRIPPLRDRTEDIPLLAAALVARAAARLGRPVEGLSPDALDALHAQRWPGNVRELENTLERAVLVASGPRVSREDLGFPPAALAAAEGSSSAGAGPSPQGLVHFGPDDGREGLSIKRWSAELERHLIAAALVRTGGNRTAAARLLDLSVKALAYKCRDYGIDP
jgi:two-component system response regulator AtoC